MWGDAVHHAGSCLPLWQARGWEPEAIAQDACYAASEPLPWLCLPASCHVLILSLK